MSFLLPLPISPFLSPPLPLGSAETQALHRLGGHSVTELHPCPFCCILRQGLAQWPRLALNLQSSCLTSLASSWGCECVPHCLTGLHRISAVLFFIALQNVCCFLCFKKIFFLVTGFLQFDYNEPQYSSFLKKCFCAWGLLSSILLFDLSLLASYCKITMSFIT